MGPARRAWPRPPGGRLNRRWLCFVQGERDEVCSLKEMRLFYSRLPEPKELVVIEAASHLFDGKTSEVGDALEDLLADFLS